MEPNTFMSWVLIVCLNSNGAACESREIIPYEGERTCADARQETGLPLPDQNFAGAYKGQDFAYCLPITALEKDQ